MIVKRELDPACRWFREARFGMFVHFGLYAIWGRGEWVMYHEGIRREDYEPLMRRFNPKRFDADTWVDIARRGGAKYITITAKHHDGFCLFDSALTDYKVTRTPFGRDLIGELVDACHRGDMRICFYYSQPDWHHPCFVNRKGAFKELPYTREDDTPDWDAYVKYYHGQVRELCTNYGRIDGIWFDGSHRSERDWRGREIYRTIKKLQPHAVVNDRGGYGDYFTPERRLCLEVGADGYTTEACQAVDAESWGYKRLSSFHSAPVLIRSLVKQASVGGNFLLNIGPKPDGTLPKEQVERFLEVGAWLKRNGGSVYAAEGCGRNRESDDMLYTRKGDKLYLHLLRWPDKSTLCLERLGSLPSSARLLGAGGRLQVAREEEATMIKGLPPLPPDPSVSVIELTFRHPKIFRPLPRTAVAPILELDGRSPLSLTLRGARLVGYGVKGSTIRIPEGEPQPDEIILWNSAEQKATWKVRTDRAFVCEVSVEMACKDLYAGSEFRLKVGKQVLHGVVPSCRSQTDFKRVKLGRIRLTKGVSALTLQPTRLNYNYVFANVKRIILKPVL